MITSYRPPDRRDVSRLGRSPRTICHSVSSSFLEDRQLRWILPPSSRSCNSSTPIWTWSCQSTCEGLPPGRGIIALRVSRTGLGQSFVECYGGQWDLDPQQTGWASTSQRCTFPEAIGARIGPWGLHSIIRRRPLVTVAAIPWARPSTP